MGRSVIISCAVTGGGDAGLKEHPGLPKSPEQICESALEAAAAGAAILHFHVREPDTGKASNRFELYAELMDRLRRAGTDAIINLTCSMDGVVALDPADPSRLDPSSTLARPENRVRHALALKPDIATIDCGVTCVDEKIFVARMSDLRAMARLYMAAGIKPEIECFEFGHIENARRLVEEGLIKDPPMVQICLGTGYGAVDEPYIMDAMRRRLPDGSVWASFGCDAREMPMVGHVVLAGGHVRVGLEDNRFLDDGSLASNAQLVAKAAQIIEGLGDRVATPAEARRILGIPQLGH